MAKESKGVFEFDTVSMQEKAEALRPCAEFLEQLEPYSRAIGALRHSPGM